MLTKSAGSPLLVQKPVNSSTQAFAAVAGPPTFSPRSTDLIASAVYR